MKYYTLEITDDMPEGFGGYTENWWIKIRPKYQDDPGILEHEKCHVRQLWRTLFMHNLLLNMNWYRLRCEVEAYKEQLACPPANNQESYRVQYAEFISTKYGLDISVEGARKLLS